MKVNVPFYYFCYFCCKPRLKELKFSPSAVAEILLSGLKFCGCPELGRDIHFVDMDCGENNAVLELGTRVMVSLKCQTACGTLVFLLMVRADVLLVAQFFGVTLGNTSWMPKLEPISSVLPDIFHNIINLVSA